MIKSSFYLQSRLKVFWESINRPELKSPGFILNLSGWLLTFLFTAVSIENGTGFKIVYLLSFGFFWYRLNKDIIKFVTPPTEVLLLFLFILYVFTYSLLYSTFSAHYALQINPEEISGFTGFFYKFFLLILLLIFGLILIINNKIFQENLVGKSGFSDKNYKKTIIIRQGVILGYSFIGLFAHNVLFFEHEYYLYLFQFFLLLFLLNRTNWLEKLSKVELWTYLLVFIFIFLLVAKNSFLQHVKVMDSYQSIFWFSIPLYLHLLIKIYLIAIIIKIPIVLIYNHARLARKLWISGLFQSSFPQLIQFICLFFIFYFLLSGWQAENLRETMFAKFGRVKPNEISSEIISHKLKLGAYPVLLTVEEYEPFEFKKDYPDQGIIELTKIEQRGYTDIKDKDYFLYMKSSEYLNRYLTLFKINAAFARHLNEHITFLAGTGLLIYANNLKDWQKFILESDFFEGGDQSKIYPFAITSDNTSWSIKTRMKKYDLPERGFSISAGEYSDSDREFIVGRILIPVVNGGEGNDLNLSFDVYFILEYTFFETDFFKIILVLIILFLLINGFVIRRVVKFGTQINQIIIQKFNQLKIGIREISGGNLDYKFKLEGEDEFVELAGRFNQMGDRLKETIAEAREKDRLDHELKIARQVQIGLLPTKLPKIPGYKIAASLQTATEVGGDFYDVLAIEKNKYLFTIGDVSGKGSSAAFYMAQFISLLRYSYQFTTKPDEITLRINKYFATHVADRQIFITAVIGILDLDKNSISFVRAGHTLPVLIPGKENKIITEISLPGLGIGLTKKQQMFKKFLKVHEISLDNYDKLVFYTDGVVEAACPTKSKEHNAADEVYGEGRFIALLDKNRQKNANQLLDKVFNDINTFYGDKPKVDDFTLLIIQRTDD